jgi:plastocyanin
MTGRPIRALGLFATLALAACGATASTTAPSAAVSGAPAPSAAVSGAPAPSTAVSGAPAPSTGVEAACAPTGAAGTVAVSIKDFEFTPAAISAKVGDVIAFTNTGPAQHTATLDQGDCGTERLSSGSVGGLTFSKAGTYPFHCAVHASMVGTITITD